MPKNPLLFPDNFLLDSTASESGIAALEVAVNNLQIASKAGAVRQAHAIRQGGLHAIKNQNRGMPTLNSLLPTRSIGRYTAAPSVPSGTLGYFLSGYGDDTLPTFDTAITSAERFVFATDTAVNLGTIAPISDTSFSVSNTTNGYWGRINDFFRISFDSEAINSIGARIFPSRYFGASLKSISKGYMCCGKAGGTVYTEVDRFSFVGESCVSVGSVLQARVYSCGYGNKFNGYLGGGWVGTHGSLKANVPATANIERFAYASESKINISAALNIPKALGLTWMPGSQGSAYIIGGTGWYTFPTPFVDPLRSYFSKTIEKFVFSGETISTLGSTISVGRSNFGAIGNASRVVMAGGATHSDAYNAQQAALIYQKTVWDFNFNTEVSSVLSATLSIDRVNIPSVDNSSF